MSILKSLNPVQKEAVEYNLGHHIIIAGAGTGKTRVLTSKVAYIIKEEEYEPESILALTFTNKAANEMKLRIKKLAGEKAEKIWMGTFHSIFARILRVEAKKLDYEHNFSIYDKEDSVSLVNNILEQMNISFDNYNPNNIHSKISFCKNHMISAEEYINNIASNAVERKIGEIFKEYTKRLKLNNSMDFDDLLLKPIELFNSNEKVLTKYRKQFRYILVDEFQDTNKAQYEILKMLVFGKTKLCVVGDDAQSIYGWRGADIKNMLSFENDFPKCKVFRLEQNYRSTKTILRAADSVIKNNQEQLTKTLWTDNEEGDKVSYIRCSDEKDEAFQISRRIKDEITKKKLSLKDIAILYRINSQSRALEEGMRKAKIAYKIIGGVEFYKRKEIKDIVAYLRVIVNQNDEESLLRIMNFPQRGIGNTSITKMISFARKLNLTLFTTMARVFEVIEVKERIQKNVKQFKLLLDKYIDLREKLSLFELTSTLIDELEVLKMYKEENSAESKQRYDNVQELLSAIRDFTTQKPDAAIEDFLAEVSLIAGIDSFVDEENSITMMTVHSAKGLEFPVVFVTGLEEDIFPLNTKFDSNANTEEERRLFYVGCTRAKNKLYLTYSRSRYRFGEVAYQGRSRFLEEMDETVFDEQYGLSGRKAGRKKLSEKENNEYYQESYDDDYDQEQKSVRVGSRVTHEIFGEGKVLQIAGTGDQQKISVAFEEAGTKHLLTKFANLKVL